ncbi:BTAD domain-containing putative transcriptional regulator [Micromonospora sp. NPDC003197]
MTRQASTPGVAFGVLGPLEAVDGRGPVPLKGPRHRTVLARLLIARGRVVSTDRLVDDLWTTPPEGAVAAIRTFVADLRRALEPDRPSRQPARLLVTAPPGYALRATPAAVDAWRFEAAVAESARLLAAGEAGPALRCLDDALALWRGPAYGEWAAEGWARAEIDRLDELRILAVERRAEALLALGRAAEAASDLSAHVRDYPLREDAWRLLATARYRAGRQGEALAALRQARETLVAELGIDPGPRLRELESDILAQAPHLTPTPPIEATSVTAAASRPPPSLSLSPEEPRPFVGRDEELGRLLGVAEQVARSGRPGLVLVSGDAGAGKTALAEALTRRLAADGWTTAWGRSPEYEGAPVAWPWTQITNALAGTAPAGGANIGSANIGSAEEPAVARFRLHRTVVSLVTTVAERGPVLLVLDDLHRADEDTLDLLVALLGEPEPVTGPVLVVGTFRATEISPVLTTTLARLARNEPVRSYLGGLAEPATGELVRAVVGPDPDPSAVRQIHRRSGGNPFFVRELARLFEAEGGTALERVPAGVRDVIRHRLAQLPDAAQTLLRQAAVIGRDIHPDVLTALAGDDPAVLDALDHAVQAGFLIEADTGGGFLAEQGIADQLRFTHILVRDTLYGDLSALRRTRWHAAVGEAIERLHPDDVAALAHHFTQAASRATAPRAANYARAAAEQAEGRSNLHEAARRWQQAVEAYDRAGGDDVPGRLSAVMGLGRALAVTGRLAEARRHRVEAITVAERIDDPDLMATVLAAFEVPAVWTRNDDEQLSQRIVQAARRVLAALPEGEAEQRSRLLSTLVLELRGTTTEHGRRSAQEAETLARQTGHPALLAFALNARFMHTFERTGLAEARARIGAELVDLAARHELVTFEVLGHLILLQAHCAFADLAAADTHARTVDRLAEQYDLPLVGVFTRWYAALRRSITGHLGEAEAAYRAANASLPQGGMPGLEQGLLPLALLSLRLSGDRSAPADPDEWAGTDWGPYEPWVRPLVLLAADRRVEALAALRTCPESPYDLLREARLCLTARAALALDDHDTMAYVYAELLPAAAELAGAGSGVLTLGPVAGYLGDLATALGRSDEADVHWQRAEELTGSVTAADGNIGCPGPDSRTSEQ